MAQFDLSGLLRRVRRRADLSQRQLADRLQISKSSVAAVELGARDLGAGLLAEAAALAGLRVVLVDRDGHEVEPMRDGAARDRAERRFPAHLDTRHGDEDWWFGWHRYDRRPPRYTFDRDRRLRDGWRAREGTPDDHLEPRPEDDLGYRAELRAQAAREARQAVTGTPRRRAVGPARAAGLYLPGDLRGPPRDGEPARSGLPVRLRHRLIRCYRGPVRGSLLLLSSRGGAH